jgi:hypothetical protein
MKEAKSCSREQDGAANPKSGGGQLLEEEPSEYNLFGDWGQNNQRKNIQPRRW